MKNIMNTIKSTVKNHKKLVIVLSLLITVSVIGTVIVLNQPKTVEPTESKQTEVKQDSKQDKKSSTKEDKKSDEKKHDDKKSDSKETSTNEVKADEPKNTDNATSNTTVAPAENSTSATNNNTTSNSTSNNAPAPCVPTYTTVNHPAVGHYETQVIRDAWDQPVYEMRIVGLVTGRIYNNLDEFDNQEEDGNYTVKQVQVDTIHHEAETQQVWVEDQPAYTTTEASGC